MMKKSILSLLVLTLVLMPGYKAAQQRQLDVPYVPTKYPVVDEMLRMAKIEKGDIVYDLGCGDGRLVVGAAQKYCARGVGIDIDPERIQESRENAAKAGVSNLVQFFEGDLFQADFHDASVMTLYLLTSVNLKLRPKLIRELRPGTRVVSHNFGMGDWQADESSSVMVDDISHEVYLWIVPANVSGKWTWSMGKPSAKVEMNLSQLFQVFSGTALINGQTVEIREPSLRGDAVRFALDMPFEGKVVSMVFEGRAAGHSITGTVKFQGGGKETTLEWKARRTPGTEKPIDTDSDRY